MIAFDTNHLVRHLLQDDEKQCGAVASLIAGESQRDTAILILDMVILETNWVLESVFGVSRSGWAEIVECLLADAIFCFEDPERIRLAVRMFRKGKADFSDYLILAKAKAEGCQLKTFDKNLLPDTQAGSIQ